MAVVRTIADEGFQILMNLCTKEIANRKGHPIREIHPRPCFVLQYFHMPSARVLIHGHYLQEFTHTHTHTHKRCLFIHNLL